MSTTRDRHRSVDRRGSALLFRNLGLVMRILHLDSGLVWRGGQQQLYYLADGMRKIGVGQFLAIREGSFQAARLGELNLPIMELNLSSEFDLRSLFALARIIRRFQPQIIHAHDSRTLGLAAVLRATGCGIKIVAARRVPFSIRHNPLWKFKYSYQTNRVIAVSNYIRDLLIREGLQQGQVEVVYDAVDKIPVESKTHRASSRQRLGVSDAEFVIGCVGQFTSEKGQEFLIQAYTEILDKYPDCRLALVGDGDLYEKCQKLLERLRLRHSVILTGFVSDLDTLLPAVDLLVHPALIEGLGSVLLKAMAHGIPVCASRTGGIPELVIEGETGFLFPPGNPKGIAQAVFRARREPMLANQQVECALSRIRSNFLVDRMVAETSQIYSNVMDS